MAGGKSVLETDCWRRLEEVYVGALNVSDTERGAWLISACGEDEQLLREVEALLDRDVAESPVIAGIVDEIVMSLLDEDAKPDAMVGMELGNYRILSELGRGGMGAVYLAVRSDETFNKQVAIKLVKRGLDTDAILQRFRYERRILAALEHPYIARLIDAGTSPDGRPYFVMEYVHGKPLDLYVREQNLTVAQRCELVAKICDAVSYAHRNLIIHRDLKPANILIADDGNPKLLDFGIAKLLSYQQGEAGPETRGPFRPLTPEYASPEQVMGETAGTACDVYSLGVVLYELLAGERPRGAGYQAEKASVVALRAGRGRRWSRRIAGDLDNILQKALRAEPERRYLTVGQFQADLNQHLKGLPISAREDAPLYRLGKLLWRHRLGTAAVLLLILSLTGGMAATLWQARRAEAQTQIAQAQRIAAEHQAAAAARAQRIAENEHAEAERQRASADHQRELADRRFSQVRDLAGRFLFDFNDSITPLPGSTPARKQMVETGIRYFDTLVKDAAGNRDLLEEIARGYDRLGDVQGNPYSQNIGDVNGALVSYQKARAIRQKIIDPSDEFLRDRIQGSVKFAELMLGNGNYDEAERLIKQAIGLVANQNARPRIVREALGNAWDLLGDTYLWEDDYRRGLKPRQEALTLRRQLAKESPGSPEAIRAWVVAETKLGEYYFRTEDPEPALDHLQAARNILLPLSGANPNKANITRALRITDMLLGNLLYDSGKYLAKPGEAAEILLEASTIAQKMLASDPENTQGLEDLAITDTAFGQSLHDDKDLEGARQAWERGLAAALKLGSDGTNAGILSQLYRRFAILANDQGKLAEALAQLQKSADQAVTAEQGSTNTTALARRLTEIEETRADIYQAAKRWPEAIATLRGNIALYKGLLRRDPENPSLSNALLSLYIQLADCYAGAGQFDNARKTVQTALDRFTDMEAKRAINSGQKKQREDVRAKLAAWAGK